MTERLPPDGDDFVVSIQTHNTEEYGSAVMRVPHRPGYLIEHLVEPICWRVCISTFPAPFPDHAPLLRVEGQGGQTLYETYTRLPGWGALCGFRIRAGDDYPPATLFIRRGGLSDW